MSVAAHSPNRCPLPSYVWYQDMAAHLIARPPNGVHRRGVSLRPQRSVCDRVCPGAAGDDDASVAARPVCRSLLI
jgi:hypothetical protein